MAKTPRDKPDQPPSAGSNEVAEAIGSQLRDMYDSVLKEPVPEKLSELVRKLSRSTDKKS